MLPAPLCLICSGVVEPRSDVFPLERLLSLWRPIVFSETVVTEHLRQASVTQLFECGKCGLQAFFPQIIGTPQFYVEAYGLAAGHKTPEFTYSIEKWDFEQALEDAKGCANLIEFGCGPGHFLLRAKAIVPMVCGVEYNEPAIERARGVHLNVYDESEDLSSLEGRFDAVFSFHVLEHVADPLGFMERLARLTRLGGRIGISVPNQAGPIRYIDPCVMNMPPHHATRWTLRSLCALGRKLNLHIQRVAYEPLLLENHSYYSVHWVRRTFGKASKTSAILGEVVSVALRVIFKLFRLSGFQRCPWLKGQSIYVLFIRQGEIPPRSE